MTAFPRLVILNLQSGVADKRLAQSYRVKKITAFLGRGGYFRFSLRIVATNAANAIISINASYVDNGPTPFRVVWLTAYRYGNAAVIVVFGALRVKPRRFFAVPFHVYVLSMKTGQTHEKLMRLPWRQSSFVLVRDPKACLSARFSLYSFA